MIKTNTKTKKIIEKSIISKINAGSFKTHVTASVDGIKVIDEDGHSIVGNLIDVLFPMMSGRTGEATRTVAGLNPRAITSVANSGGYLRVNFTGTYDSNATHVQLIGMNVSGVAIAALNNNTYTSTAKGTYYHVLDVAWNAAYTGATGYALPEKRNVSYLGGDTYLAAPVYVRLGVGDSATNIDDSQIKLQPFGGYAGTGYVAVAIDSENNVSRLSITETFTNTSGATITVKEVGLYMQTRNNPSSDDMDSASPFVLLGRDVFSTPISIINTQSLSVMYTISVAVTGEEPSDQSGFMGALLQILANHMRGGTQPISRYNAGGNLTPTGAYSSTRLNVIGMGRNKRWGYNGTTKNIPGIKLGTGTEQTIDVVHTSLAIPIENGDTSGCLRYIESYVDDIVSGTGYREFTIHRLVQNVSGADITVGEIGLICCIGETSTTTYVPTYYALLSRTVFAAANRFTVPDGYFADVAYTIRVQV